MLILDHIFSHVIKGRWCNALLCCVFIEILPYIYVMILLHVYIVA